MPTGVTVPARPIMSRKVLLDSPGVSVLAGATPLFGLCGLLGGVSKMDKVVCHAAMWGPSIVRLGVA